MKILRPIFFLMALLLADVSARGQGNVAYSWQNFTGQPGGAGNANGVGSAARFSNPTGLTVDSSGNLYVADTYNDIIRRVTPGGLVTTLAGSAGQSGIADGTGSAARFSYPSGVAVDSASNLYVADTFNNTIRKITAGGVVTTLAGSAGQSGVTDGTGNMALFNEPNGIAVDNAGNVYVADSGNSTIRKMTSSGMVTTLAGSPGETGSADGTGSAAQFYYPYGLAVDGAGTVYVADLDNECIRKVTAEGVVTTLAGSSILQAGFGGVITILTGSMDGTGSAAQFYSPAGVALDSADNLYVTDSGNSTLRMVTSNGVVSTLVGTAGQPGSADGEGSAASFNEPKGLAFDSAGNLYVADSGNSTIRMVTSNEMVTTLAGSAGQPGTGDSAASAARFDYPYGTAVDSVSNVYVADTYNHTIRKVTSSGTVVTLAGTAGQSGSSDGTGATARFSYPSGVAVDLDGNVYVADFGNSTLRKVTSGGEVTTLAGSAGLAGSVDGAGNAARFNGPYGIAADSEGNVYVADSYNSTIRKVTSSGVVTTLAGSPGQSGSADGAGGAAQFYYPAGVTLDGSGNLYVADTFNNTIRKVNSAGVVTTLAGSAGQTGGADGTGPAASFNGPIGLAVNSQGNLCVSDFYNDTIRLVTSNGVVTTLAGIPGQSGSADGKGSAAQFYFPAGVAADTRGNWYVADAGNNTIRKVANGGIVTTLAGTAGQSGSADVMPSDARYNGPLGVAVDTLGNLFIADTRNSTLRKVTSTGVVTTLAGSPGQSGSADGTGIAAQFSYPSGIGVDSSGNVYLADTYNFTIRRVTPGGVVTTLAGSAGQSSSADGTGGAARFSYPSGLTVDIASNLYVADTFNNTIRKITAGGVVTTLAGSAGQAGARDGLGGAASFNGPNGLALDSEGNVYVADSGNSTIRMVTSSGDVTTLAGSAGQSGSEDGVGSAARFANPYGLAVDSAGNVFVADSGNSTIRMVTSSGIVTTIGGVAGVTGGADGIGSSANFAGPSGIAVDGLGRLYVADVGNNRISMGAPLVLSIHPSGPNVILTWPSPFNGFELQESSELGNSDGWSNTVYSIRDDQTNKSILIPSQTGNLFFRLIAN